MAAAADQGNDAAGAPIANVGDGVASSDTANTGQVNLKYEQAVSTANQYTDIKFNQLQDDFNAYRNDVDQRFEGMDRRIDRMGALSGAYAGMAMNGIKLLKLVQSLEAQSLTTRKEDVPYEEMQNRFAKMLSQGEA